MNNIIPFKKDIIFKTNISNITDITLTHDYKIMSDMVEGEFFLSGTYKITEASVINEEFYYNIPFSISISDRIKTETISLSIKDFKYSLKKDTLTINIDLDMSYEENEIENAIDSVINDFTEESERMENNEGEDKIEEINSKFEEIIESEIETVVNPIETNINKEQTINNLLSDVNTINEYTTYKVHIVRNDDTFESIASKYNVSLDNIKEYNKIGELNVGDKILVPFIYNE